MRAFLIVCLISFGANAQNFNNHQKHTAAALAALQAESTKEGKDCVQVQNQRQDTECISQVAEAADKNLGVFLENLKALLGPDDQKKLQGSQDAWNEYRKKACGAVFDFYVQGSIRYSAQSRCEIRLARERMRDLDSLYEGPLHH